MRQALLAGVSAMLMAVLLPGWLLPVKTQREPERLVLIMEQPAEKQKETTVQLRHGSQLLELPLEDYLVGVVLSEIPASFASEALKAQAVAARTFAMRQLDAGKHTDCDLCSDSSCCQAWNSRDVLEEKLGDSSIRWWSRAEQAVRATAGEVLFYEDGLIDAVYFSCSGGQTEDAVAVWGSDVPYLQSVPSEGEEAAAVFQSEKTVSCAAFRETVLSVYPDADFSQDPSFWIGDVVYTQGGGVDTVVIGGQTVKGTALRSLFHLNSTNIAIRLEQDQIVFAVKGYGHRVGMSQYGANAMAKTGSTYREILQHYYTGAEIRCIQ